MTAVPLLAALACLFVSAGMLRAETVHYVERGSDWRYFPGQTEASDPVDAWRQLGFDASSWSESAAPFGYGDPPLGTDLADETPSMRNNYLSVFLRKTFEVVNASHVDALEIEVDYDDGFVLWINWVELVRPNVPGDVGDPVAFDDTSEDLSLIHI